MEPIQPGYPEKPFEATGRTRGIHRKPNNLGKYQRQYPAIQPHLYRQNAILTAHWIMAIVAFLWLSSLYFIYIYIL